MPWRVPTFNLPNGAHIPLIGLGCYTFTDDELIVEVLDRAFSAGYRLIDTAAMYNTEKEIGSALKKLLPKHNLRRKDVFITAKLDPGDHGEGAINALRESLDDLQLDYVDLYLINWPGAYGVSSTSAENSKLRAASWASLVKAKEEGLAKHLGVSSYTTKHLKELLENCHGVRPVVNQIEWHPACHQDEIKELCDKEGVLVQAYMPLGNRRQGILYNDYVVAIAEKLQKEPAQILLRWSLQQNVAVIIPKATSQEHLEANINLDFVIPDEDMLTLSTKIKHYRFDWDPNTIA